MAGSLFFLDVMNLSLVGGWTNPSEKIFVKMDHSPKVRGENKKICEVSPPSDYTKTTIYNATLQQKRSLSSLRVTRSNGEVFSKGDLAFQKKPRRGE